MDVPPIRLSAETDSPHFSPAAHDSRIRVFLNGKRQFNVYEYSQPEGWVKRYATDEDGRIKVVLGDVVKEQIHGVVSVDFEGGK